MIRVCAILMFAALAAPALAAAQVGHAGPSDELVATRWSLSGGFVVAQPVGEFSDHVGTGFGGVVQALYRLDRAGIVSLRGDLAFVNYGRERRRVCFSATVGCRVLLDLTTNNNILMVGLGPHLEAPFRAVRPYVNAGVGAGYFATTSSLRGSNRNDDFASTTNFSDLTFAWGAGTGVNIPIRGGITPLNLQIGVRYHGNGQAEYVREGDIEDQPDGSIVIHTTRSQANLITYQIGVSAVIGRRR